MLNSCFLFTYLLFSPSTGRRWAKFFRKLKTTQFIGHFILFAFCLTKCVGSCAYGWRRLRETSDFILEFSSLFRGNDCQDFFLFYVLGKVNAFGLCHENENYVCVFEKTSWIFGNSFVAQLSHPLTVDTVQFKT